MITACDLCDPVRRRACVRVCAVAFASVSVFACVLARESRTKRAAGVEGFVCHEGTAAMHIQSLGARDDSRGLIKDGS